MKKLLAAVLALCLMIPALTAFAADGKMVMGTNAAFPP